jgi:hypothetical protein
MDAFVCIAALCSLNHSTLSTHALGVVLQEMQLERNRRHQLPYAEVLGFEWGAVAVHAPLYTIRLRCEFWFDSNVRSVLNARTARDECCCCDCTFNRRTELTGIVADFANHLRGQHGDTRADAPNPATPCGVSTPSMHHRVLLCMFAMCPCAEHTAQQQQLLLDS